MRRKHFLNTPELLVDGMCQAVVAQNPILRYDPSYKVVFRRQNTDSLVPRVTLISGGGSGHEPAHAGYVGKGLLDAAVCGAVFASPNVTQILQGLQYIKSSAGILVIVKNYTGDKLNFGLAVEEFRAKTAIPIRTVTVGDDVAVPRSRGLNVGRRGLAGTVFVHKIAGSASERGYSLDAVAKVSQHVANNLATIGVSLDHASVPGQSVLTSLGAGDIELGMGIHNEPGVKILSPQPDLTSLVDSMLSHILDQEDQERAFVDFGLDLSQAKVVLLVNNLGGLSVLELSAASSTVLRRLASQYGIKPLRFYSGTFLTSLDGPGFSITLLNVKETPGGQKTEEILSLLDDNDDSLAWPRSAQKGQVEAISIENSVESGAYELPTLPKVAIPGDIPRFIHMLEKIRDSVKEQEPKITKLDTLMGDGDCGTTLLTGAEAVLKQIQANPPNDLSAAISTTAKIARNAMGGTSGALYGLFLGALASALQELFAAGYTIQISTVADAAGQALETLKNFTAARQGSRTLMDALIPFVQELKEASMSKQDALPVLEKAFAAAKFGVETTKTMKSFFGRSTYVGAHDESNGDASSDATQGLPDPGACGVVAVIEGITAALLL